MTIPKKYVHDRIVLLLLTCNIFLVIVVTLEVLLRLNAPQAGGYIAQYRPNLGIGAAYKKGGADALLAFVVFAAFILLFNTFLSIKVYHIRRHFAVAILGMALLLLILTLIVSNSLLALR